MSTNMKFSYGAISKPVFAKDGAIWVNNQGALYRVEADEMRPVLEYTKDVLYTALSVSEHRNQRGPTVVCPPVILHNRVYVNYSVDIGEETRQSKLAIYSLAGELLRERDLTSCWAIFAGESVLFTIGKENLQILDLEGNCLHRAELPLLSHPSRFLTHAVYRGGLLFLTSDDYKNYLYRLSLDGALEQISIYEEKLQNRIGMLAQSNANCRWIYPVGDRVYVGQHFFDTVCRGLRLQIFQADEAGTLSFRKETLYEGGGDFLAMYGNLALRDGNLYYMDYGWFDNTGDTRVRLRIASAGAEEDVPLEWAPPPIRGMSHLPMLFLPDGSILSVCYDLRDRFIAVRYLNGAWSYKQIPAIIYWCEHEGEVYMCRHGREDFIISTLSLKNWKEPDEAFPPEVPLDAEKIKNMVRMVGGRIEE